MTQSLPRELVEQIEARKIEAEEKGIRELARFIALNLGRHSSLDDGQGTTDKAYAFGEGELTIEIKDSYYRRGDEANGSTTVQITFAGRIVFRDINATLYIFIPGTWEDQLIGLRPNAQAKYAQNMNAVSEEQAKNNAVLEAAERAKWGL